jgi:hypothetical protein
MTQDPKTCIDLIPQRLVDPFTDKVSWFVDETEQETGNLYESFEFKTQKQADYFISLWAEVGEDAAVKYHHCLNRSNR